MITVFYDGKCGLCSREIKHYQKIANPSKFDWVDISLDSAPLNQLNISHAEALKILHAIDNHGNLVFGVNAFRVIWDELPRWWLLSKLISIPIIFKTANYIYLKFAGYRFRSLEHCRIANTIK